MLIKIPEQQDIIKNYQYFDNCLSTNTLAYNFLAEQSNNDGVLVVAEQQSQGRGQRGNSWEAVAGKNITMSLGFYPKKLAASLQFYLNIAVCVSIFDFLKKYKLPDLSIKWPNDIYIGRQKIAGVLIENTLVGANIYSSVIGIGLNVNQLEFAWPKATSLALIKGREYSVPQLIESLAQSLVDNLILLNQYEYADMKKYYLENLFRKNSWATYRWLNQTHVAQIVDVTEAGQLIVEHENEYKYFDFKEIEYIID
jgi:BirA family transcriptional regulator, biotin operon repressor / biotin---[acetyl-CoA-carboxylase] ligase